MPRFPEFVLTVAILVILYAMAHPAHADDVTETLVPLRVTPTIPGGEPFPDPVVLPNPEPNATVLLVCGATLILSGRPGRAR